MNRLPRALAAAVVAVGVLAAPAAAAVVAPVPAAPQAEIPLPDVIPGDPLGCDTNPPMNAPNSGVLALDAGPETWATGDPFAENPTVSMYEVYGFAGMEWTNFDLGCGPDAVRDTNATIGGAVSNAMWNALLGTASAVTAVQRWTYDPDTLDVFEPVQRVAAEALGNRVFRVLFGLTLAVAGGFIIFRSRHGNVREAANHGGWAMLVLVLAMACILWPAKIAPAADDAVTGAISMVNSAVAGGTSSEVSIADTNAANVQHGVLYSTWASGTFGRASGATVEKYGPALFRNGALTREEAKLLQTDPEAAQEIIEKKKDRFNAAAENLKDEDPIAYEYLAGKHNWSRMIYAGVGWFAYACAMAYQLVASLLLLASLIIMRIAVMLLPLLAIAGAYYPWRGIVIRVLDYVAGAIAAAVMFGGASAVFTAVMGGIMSPTTNTPVMLSALLMLLVTLAGFKLTKPLRAARSFGMPGLNPFRRAEHPADGTAPTHEAPVAPQPQETYTRPVEPSSATYRHSFARQTATGAAQGAAAGAAFAAITGGTSVAAGATTGAAKAAAAETVATATGSAALGTAAGAAATKALPSAMKELPAGTTPKVHQEVPDVSARRVVEGERVWQPGEANPAETLRPTTAEKGVYPIFQPVKENRR